MDTIQGWLSGDRNAIDLKALSASIGFNNPHAVKLAKEALVAGALLVGIVYVVQTYFYSRKPNRSWLKLRRDSPDPEKNDDPGRYAAQKLKPTDRKPGSKSV